jgi:aminoglycoside phosphotransferase (APT) family kinase protein
LAPTDAPPGTAQQLDLWERHGRQELGDRRHPLLERAFAWLRAHLPDDRSIGLCWGDSRPGNMIWQNFRCACATDFEAASIASPEQDLGWWLMFDRWVHETYGIERLAGEPTRDDQRELYADLRRVKVADTRFHEIFAATRYGVIVVRVMNRSVARGAIPADQTIWLDNPAVTCLAQLLDEYT